MDDKSKFYCSQCEQGFSTKKRYNNHVNSDKHLKNTNQAIKSDKCELCNVKLASPHERKKHQHLRSHRGNLSSSGEDRVKVN